MERLYSRLYLNQVDSSIQIVHDDPIFLSFVLIDFLYVDLPKTAGYAEWVSLRCIWTLLFHNGGSEENERQVHVNTPK